MKRWLLSLGLLVVAASSASSAGLLPYGSRAGMRVTIVELKGIDTETASIRVEHTRANAKAFCVEYVQTADEQCVEQTLREVRLNDVIKANCKTGLFTNLGGASLRFAGASPPGEEPKYRIFRSGSTELLDASMASGYKVNLDQFTALCPEAVIRAEPPPSPASYFGRWYEGTDRSVCKEQPGTADGLLVYSAKEAIGLENWCRVAGIKTVGSRTDLILQCRAEGQAEHRRESLEVVGGRLKRTIAEGRKQYVFFYNRCP